MVPNPTEPRHVRFENHHPSDSSKKSPTPAPQITATATETAIPAYVADALRSFFPNIAQPRPQVQQLDAHSTYFTFPSTTPVTAGASATSNPPATTPNNPAMNMINVVAGGQPQHAQGVPVSYYPQVANGFSGAPVHHYVPRHDPVVYYIPVQQQAAIPVSPPTWSLFCICSVGWFCGP